MAKINMKNVLKALGLLGLGATIGHITQVIHDCRIVEDEGDFNALGRFSWKVCEYWKSNGDKIKEAKDEVEREKEKEATVDEADDEWDAWPNVMHLDDLPTTEEEPSE